VLHNYLPDSSNAGIYSSDKSVSLQLSTYLSPESHARQLGTIGDNNHLWFSELDTVL